MISDFCFVFSCMATLGLRGDDMGRIYSPDYHELLLVSRFSTFGLPRLIADTWFLLVSKALDHQFGLDCM